MDLPRPLRAISGERMKTLLKHPAKLRPLQSSIRNLYNDRSGRMQTIVGLPLYVFKTIKSLPIIGLRKKGGIKYIKTIKLSNVRSAILLWFVIKCSITSRQAKKEKMMDTQKKPRRNTIAFQ